MQSDLRDVGEKGVYKVGLDIPPSTVPYRTTNFVDAIKHEGKTHTVPLVFLSEILRTLP